MLAYDKQIKSYIRVIFALRTAVVVSSVLLAAPFLGYP